MTRQVRDGIAALCGAAISALLGLAIRAGEGETVDAISAVLLAVAVIVAICGLALVAAGMRAKT